jgi:S-adenosylmethionine uptake transporter
MMTFNKENNFLGLSLGLTGYIVIVLVDSIIKLNIVGKYPVIQISFFLCIGAFIPNITSIVILRQWSVLINSKIYLQLLHGVFGLAHGNLIINSLKKHSLIEIYPILFSSPLILTILSYFFLKEKIGIRRILAVLLGFIGVLIVSRPGTMHFTIPLFGLFIAAIIHAVRVLVIRQSKNQSSIAFTFYGCLSAFIISGFLSYQNFELVQKTDLIILVVCGMIAGMAGLCFAIASKTLESSLFAPIQYIQLVAGFTMGYFFFGDLPDIYEVIGSLVIVFSGLFIIYRENQLKIRTLVNSSNKIRDMFFRGL